MRASEILAARFVRGDPVAGASLAAQVQVLGSPRFLYHASPMANLRAVQRDGLVLHAGSRRAALYGQYPLRIYFSLSDESVVSALQQHEAQLGVDQWYVIFAVDVARLPPEIRLFRDPEDRQSVYTETGFVPADALHVVQQVAPSLRQRFYAAAIQALRAVGVQSPVGESFAVDDDAILIRADEPITDTQVKQASAIVHDALPEVGPLVIQTMFDPDENDPYTEIVGYLGKSARSPR